MKRTIAASLAAIAIGAAPLSTTACSSMPEPCTTEWVHWKTERFIADFVRGHQRQFNDARNSAAMLAGVGGIDSAATIPVVLAAAGIISLASDFMSDLWPEVRDALSQCDSAPRAAQLFASILRDEGVDERAARAVEDLGLLLDRRS